MTRQIFLDIQFTYKLIWLCIIKKCLEVNGIRREEWVIQVFELPVLTSLNDTDKEYIIEKRPNCSQIVFMAVVKTIIKLALLPQKTTQYNRYHFIIYSYLFRFRLRIECSFYGHPHNV